MIDYWKLLEERSEQNTLEGAAFTVDTPALKNALARIAPAYLTRQASFPVVKCAKAAFDAGTETLTLTLTDLEVTLTAKIPAKGSANGGTCIHYLTLKRFIGVVRAARTGFFPENEKWAIKSGTACMIPAIYPVADFPEDAPKDDAAACVEIEDAARLVADFARAIRFSSSDDSRKVLTGIMVEHDSREGRLRLVATNGKQLFCAKSAACQSPFPAFILPAKTAAALVKSFARYTGKMEIRPTAKRVTFSAGDITLTGKTIEGQYPNWRQVIPTGFTNEVQLSAFVLAWGCNCVGGGERGAMVDFEVKPGALHLVHHSDYFGCTMETEIPAETGKAEPGQVFGFNGDFLADATAVGENLLMRWTTIYNPITILNDDYTYLIMPIRKR